MPTPRSQFGIATVSGKVYAIGGVNDSGNVSNVEVFDAAINAWQLKTPMPTSAPSTGLGISVVGSKILILGGYTGALYSNTVYEYDPLNDY